MPTATAVPTHDPTIDWVHSFRLTPQGAICQPTPSMIRQAQAIRTYRDTRYGDHFQQQASDLKWVGDLGEMCVYAFLKDLGMPCVWRNLLPNGEENLTAGAERISVKTVKRQVPMRPNYGIQISAAHRSENTDWFCFLSYEYPNNTMWLLGAIPPAEYLKRATYNGEGSKIHHSYAIRKGHAIYNAPASILMPPDDWLNLLLTRAGILLKN